jgi:hypothetical protein
MRACRGAKSPALFLLLLWDDTVRLALHGTPGLAEVHLTVTA